MKKRFDHAKRWQERGYSEQRFNFNIDWKVEPPLRIDLDQVFSQQKNESRIIYHDQPLTTEAYSTIRSMIKSMSEMGIKVEFIQSVVGQGFYLGVTHK